MIIKSQTGLAKNISKEKLLYKGFLGISIRNRFFSKRVVKHYIQWAEKNLQRLDILLFDDPDRFNLMVFKGFSEKIATQKAREIGKNHQKAYQKIINELNAQKKTKILTFQDLLKDPLFVKYDQKTHLYIKKNTLLQEYLIQDMYNNIGEKISLIQNDTTLTDDEKNNKIKTLSQYIFSELSPLLYMLKKGYLIEIDPHEEFLAKKQLYQGKFPHLFQELQLPPQRGHLNMQPALN